MNGDSADVCALNNARTRLADQLRDAVEASCRTVVGEQELDALADLVAQIESTPGWRYVYSRSPDLRASRTLFCRPWPGEPAGAACGRRERRRSVWPLASGLAPYEGYPGMAHGGVIALLLDDVLGRFVRSLGRGGMTARLDIEYELPASRDILVRARLDRIDRRKTWVVGEIVAAAESTEVLARAVALFIVRRPPTIV